MAILYVLNLVSLPTGKPVTEANEQPLQLSPPTPHQPLPDLKFASNVLPPSPQSLSPLLLPSIREPGEPWDHVHPPTIISYLNGPHFSYDHASAFNSGTPVTPGSYQNLLTDIEFASELNIARNISFIQ